MERGAEGARPSSRTQVLIAEGDQALADLYRSALEEHGWRVETVAHAAALMEQLRRAPPTVLLLSALPDANQLMVAEKVRSLPGMEALVIVVLYDSLDHIDTDHLSRLKVNAWLSKTRTTREKIASTIAGLVKGSSQPRS